MKERDPIEFLARLDWNESDHLEFKSAKGGLPGDLWETYSAFANTQGGVIFLGVRDNGKIQGVSEVEKLKKQFWDSVNNKQKVSINLLASADLQTSNHSGKDIIAIRVPRADRRDRPVFIGQNPLAGTYRRNHEGDYHCTEREVRRMLADSSEETVDERVLEGFSLEDLDLQSLKQYRNRMASKTPDHPWLEEDDIGFLRKLGGWRLDRKSGVSGLTKAGLLMFGKDETICEGVPQYQIDFRERLSLDPSVRWTDRVTQDGTWNSNLYQFFNRVIQKLFNDIKVPFELDEDLSRKGETPVHVAIREALANALIHADYQGQGGVIIEKYPDRLEFSNPGSLLISMEQALSGGVSECRNKVLQKMFSMIGVSERAGSGIDRIKKGWSSQYWRLPMVREQVHPDRVKWILPMISLIPEESLRNLEDRIGSRLLKLSEHEVQALVTAEIEGSVDNTRLRQLTGMHSSDATKILQGLVAQGALAQDGRGRWTQYVLPIQKELDSTHKASDSTHKELDSTHFSHIPDQIMKSLIQISSTIVGKKRLSRDQMNETILRLCKESWLSREQIAELVDRNAEGLRERYLTPLVERGDLELRFPDRPNRTDQAYRTMERSEAIERNNRKGLES